MSASGDRSGLGTQPIVPLYERLPHGPHHIDREEVIRHQCLRLQGALIESVATRGYHDTSVKYVLALAGVSRRAFYEQYKNKQACFLAAFDEIAERATARIESTCESVEGDLAEHLLGALGVMASEVLEHPKDAWLTFSEIDHLGQEGARHAARQMASFERWLSERLGPEAPVPLLKALVGAIRRIVCLLLSEHRAHELPRLNERMLSWLLAPADPAAAAVHTLMRTGAKDRVGIAREAAAGLVDTSSSPREQLLLGALHATREVGHSEMSPINVADAAGLPLDTFFEYYEEYEQCFKEALDTTAERLLAIIPEPDPLSSQWPVQVCCSISSLLVELASEEILTWTITCAATEAGSWGVEHNRQLLRRLAQRICAAIPAEAVDEIVIEQAAGAIWHLTWCTQDAERTHLLAALDGYISYLVLAPIIGGQGALEAIEETRQTEREAMLTSA